MSSNNPFDIPVVEPLLKQNSSKRDYSKLFENWEDKIAWPVKMWKTKMTYDVPTFLTHFKGGNLFFRWMNDGKRHNDFQYVRGLNVDTQKFNPSGSCCRGGLYFSSLPSIRQFGGLNSGSFHLIALPNDEIVYAESLEKFKIHSFILGPEIDFTKLVRKLLKQDFPFHRLSVKFCDRDNIIRKHRIENRKIVNDIRIYGNNTNRLNVSRNIILGYEEAFRDYTFIDCSFHNIKLIDFDFGEAKLQNCKFVNCDFTLSDFSKIQGKITFGRNCKLLYTKYNKPFELEE